MIDTQRLATFAVSAFVLIVIPGPTVLFVVSRAITLGRKGALFTVLGVVAGEYVQALTVAAGIGSLISRSLAVFTVVKLAGAAYLVWLGIQAVRHRHRLTDVLDGSGPAKSPLRIMREGFVVGGTNPKVLAFFAAVLPQFVDRDLGHVPLQMAILGLIYVSIGLVTDSVWSVVAGTARHWLVRSPQRLAQLGGLGGVMIIGLGVQLATNGRTE